jgi:hypothetical protein
MDKETWELLLRLAQGAQASTYEEQVYWDAKDAEKWLMRPENRWQP